MAAAQPELSLVIPVFNQGKYLQETFAALRKGFSDIETEIVLVDDGSTRDTELFVGAEQIIRLEKNQGKGVAVRAGVLAANGKVVLYTDADLSYSPEFLSELYAAVSDGEMDAALGVRESSGGQGMIRSWGSRYFRWLTKVFILHRNIDTQCGAKAFSSKAAKEVFGKVKIKRFAFDVEVFCILQKMNAKVQEKPAHFRARDNSSVKPKDALIFVKDLCRIYRNLKKGLYD